MTPPLEAAVVEEAAAELLDEVLGVVLYGLGIMLASAFAAHQDI